MLLRGARRTRGAVPAAEQPLCQAAVDPAHAIGEIENDIPTPDPKAERLLHVLLELDRDRR